jgi:hypothetical protein
MFQHFRIPPTKPLLLHLLPILLLLTLLLPTPLLLLTHLLPTLLLLILPHSISNNVTLLLNPNYNLFFPPLYNTLLSLPPSSLSKVITYQLLDYYTTPNTRQTIQTIHKIIPLQKDVLNMTSVTGKIEVFKQAKGKYMYR